MDSGQLSFGIFPPDGMILLVLTDTIFCYLLQVKDKIRLSWMLVWPFPSLILSSLPAILSKKGTNWAWAIAPYQDTLLILRGGFVVRFV